MKVGMIGRGLVCLLAVIFFPLVVKSQDTDGDGLSDTLEQTMGPYEFSCLAGNGCLGILWWSVYSYDGHNYLKNTHYPGNTWDESRDLCRGFGGDLVYINSSAEYTWIQGTLDYTSWIGYVQEEGAAEPAGGWYWSHGTPDVLQDWAAGEPNDYNGVEDCAQLTSTSDYRFNDANCSDDARPFCEDGFGLNAREFDSDGDGFYDSFEAQHEPCLHPLYPNTFAANFDGDSLANSQEQDANTDPCAADTDADGLSDYFEINYGGQSFTCMAGDSCASTGCTVYYNAATGHHYLRCNTLLAWSAARDFCASYGGGLVEVNDAAENDWVKAWLSPSIYYMGLADVGDEGFFKWESGAGVYFTDWSAGQPDNSGGLEDCVYFWSSQSFQWNDSNCGTARYYVCEDGFGLSPFQTDTDGDGLGDKWETDYAFGGCINPLVVDSTTADPDSDNLTNQQEMTAGADPCTPDTDGDGLTDGDEVLTHLTDPLAPDTDDDGLSDGDEVLIHNTEPLDPDTDGDGLGDQWEVDYESGGCVDPLVIDSITADPDADNLSNQGEFIAGANPCNPDTDGDNLTDGDEVLTYLTDPLDPDTDGDILSDGNEVLVLNTEPLDPDTDDDGLSDGMEVLIQNTDPLDPDTDGDGLGDQWEVDYKFAGCIHPLVVDSSSADPDTDGLNNQGEETANTNPCSSDTDGDGLGDQWEADFEYTGCVDPLVVDSASADPDSDSLTNQEEETAKTNPCTSDTDGDGLGDQWELDYEFAGCVDPLVINSSTADPDTDNLTNQEEETAETNPCAPDTDGDGLGDQWEADFEYTGCVDPLVVDSASADPDLDGLSNQGEAAANTNPCSPDTDADGLTDGEEFLIYYTNPLEPDTDHDGIDDWTEIFSGADPNNHWVTGGVAQPNGINILLAGTASDTPGISWNGQRYGASWTSSNKLYFRRYTKIGLPDGPAVQLSSANSRNGCQVWTGSEYALSWRDEGPGNWEIYFARISADGDTIGANVRVTHTSSDSDNPSMVWTGSEYDIAFQDNSTGTYEIYFARLAADGSTIGQPTRISALDGSTSTNPSLAWSGSEFGVGWLEDLAVDEVRFTRISPQGSPIDPVLSKPEAAITSAPRVAHNGINFAMAWNEIYWYSWTCDLFSTCYHEEESILLREINNDGTWKSAQCNLFYEYEDGGNWRVTKIEAAVPPGIVRKTGTSNFITTYEAGNLRVRDGMGCSGTETMTSLDGLAAHNTTWVDLTYALIYRKSGNICLSLPLYNDGDVLTWDDETLYGTDPVDWDTDDDGIADSDEIYVFLTNPLDPDTDGDGMDDGWERNYFACGLDPLAADSGGDPDRDGLSNIFENNNNLNPCKYDSDGDGMDDGWESGYACVDAAVSDPGGDADGDLRDNLTEYNDRTDPCVSDLITELSRLVNYQGRLTDDAGVLVGGTVDMAFSLFDGETGGAPLWTEYHEVHVVNGIYNVILGGDTVIPSTAMTLPELYLEVSVEGEVLIPRQLITAVLHAINADLISGKRLETGVRTLTVSPATSMATVHVFFDQPFTSVPRVTVTYPNELIGGETFVGSRIYNLTSYGFDIEWKSLSGTSATGSAAFGYYAFGK